MARVTIDLQEGFTGDTVVIHLNGREVYRCNDVKTRLQIGLADRVETVVQERAATVEIGLPTKGLKIAEAIPADADIFVGVNVEVEGNLTVQTQCHEFSYV